MLGGAISPIDGIGPDQLRIAPLLQRIAEPGISEVILATDPNLEGEATATYLTRLLRTFPGLAVTRLASGLPVGGDLEYADEVTLGRAFSGRRAVDALSRTRVGPRHRGYRGAVADQALPTSVISGSAWWMDRADRVSRRSPRRGRRPVSRCSRARSRCCPPTCWPPGTTRSAGGTGWRRGCCARSPEAYRVDFSPTTGRPGCRFRAGW